MRLSSSSSHAVFYRLCDLKYGRSMKNSPRPTIGNILLFFLFFGKHVIRFCLLMLGINFIVIEMKANKSRKKINNYIIHFDRPLGVGASGKVFVCVQESTQLCRAVKVIEKSQFDNNPYMAEAVKQQLQIHRSLTHENIVSVIEVVQTANNYYIIMEFCEQGNLRNLIIQHTTLSEADALHCLRNICRAFQPMFEKGIMHRDLKPQNIVIQGDKLKVTDFGFAKALSSSRQLTRTVIGTPLYMSPQILSKQPYSSKCDIWSIGVIFFELLVGRHPWNAKSMVQLYRNITNSPDIEIPPQIAVSQQSKSFIKGCLQVEECNRLSWVQLYQTEIMGPQFEAIAIQWRKAYQSAAFKLSELKQNVEPEKLVGLFLRINVSALNFQQFVMIIKSLIPTVEEKQLGPMYELFDKDSNGVIDLQEFVGALSDCPKPILQLLNKLLMNGHSYNQLSDRIFFSQLTSKFCENPQVCESAFALINNMNMGE